MQDPHLPQNTNQNYQTGPANNVYGQPVHVVERIIEREPDIDDDGGLRLPNIFKLLSLPFTLLSTARRIITTGCLLIIVLVIVFLITIFVRPPFLWDPFKDFLNDGINPKNPQTIDLQDIYAKINIQGNEGLTAEVTEDQLTNLFRTKIQSGSDIRIELEKNLLRIVINIDSEAKPLWLVAEVTQEDLTTEPESEKLSVSKVGFGRFGLPGGINSFLGDRLFTLLSFTKQQIAGSTSAKLFGLLIDEDGVLDGIKFKDVRFEQDKAVIKFSSTKNQSF